MINPVSIEINIYQLRDMIQAASCIELYNVYKCLILHNNILSRS